MARKRIYLCLAHMSDEGIEQKYIKEAFDTNWVVPLGPNVNAFEEALKQYVEQISVVGITFRYNANNTPEGLCTGERLYYVTTAGGEIFSKEFGYGYFDFLARYIFGIKRVRRIQAENLDLDGADVEGIMKKAKGFIDSELKKDGDL